MFTIAPVYVVAAIAGAVQSASHNGCEVVESFEREIHARSGSTLTEAEAESLLAGAAVLRASLCAAPVEQTAPPRAA